MDFTHLHGILLQHELLRHAVVHNTTSLPGEGDLTAAATAVAATMATALSVGLFCLHLFVSVVGCNAGFVSHLPRFGLSLYLHMALLTALLLPWAVSQLLPTPPSSSVVASLSCSSLPSSTMALHFARASPDTARRTPGRPCAASSGMSAR